MLQAIYGGAFDPVHDGHLAVARAARDVLDADVALVPTGDPRHRAPAFAKANQRLAMLQLAIAGQPHLSVDAREIHRDRASYTVDTLEELRAELGPDVSLAMIVGDDAFAGLPGWHRWTDLFSLAHIVVASRPQPAVLPEVLTSRLQYRMSDTAAELHAVPAGRVYRLHMPLHPQSSSLVRERCINGQPLAGWVPAQVAAYIAAHGLYADT